MKKNDYGFPDINEVQLGDDDTQSVSEVLNIDEVELNIDLQEVLNLDEQQNLNNDYLFVREKIIHSIQKGELILDNILKMAQMMESGKDYKVASQVLQMIFEGSKSLMEFHKQSLSLKKEMKWLPENEKTKENENKSNQTLPELLAEIKEAKKVNNIK